MVTNIKFDSVEKYDQQIKDLLNQGGPLPFMDALMSHLVTLNEAGDYNLMAYQSHGLVTIAGVLENRVKKDQQLILEFYKFVDHLKGFFEQVDQIDIEKDAATQVVELRKKIQSLQSALPLS